MKKKLAIVYGTRPEFLKVFPIILEANKLNIDFVTINTGQHSSVLTEIEKQFDFTPNYNLKVQNLNYSNSQLLAKLISEIYKIISIEEITSIIAQGDTLSVLASSTVSFLENKLFLHIEAGLRTGNLLEPFPEEYNRRCTSVGTSIHFTPTQIANQNLLNEHVAEDNIIMVGNTIIDMLKYVLEKENIKIESGNSIMITLHRRENIGENINNVVLAIKELANENPELEFCWILHTNPTVRNQILTKFSIDLPKNINFIEPLDYINNIKLMAKSKLILSDSGGIQEEAPTLNKKILVLRNETERPEVIDCNCGVLVGSDIKKIKKEFYKELNSEVMHHYENPFGDGKSSQKILNYLLEKKII